MDGLRYRQEVGWLYQTAMLIFLVTISLGMSRGLGLIDFSDRNQLLTHLHSGTIGWVTLGILATVLWLYGGKDTRTTDDRFVTWTSVLLVVAVPVYILAWWSANLPFRAISGTLLLVGIVAFVGWLVREAARVGYRQLTTPQLGAVVGLVTLIVGSTFGVMLQIQFASGNAFLPGGAIGAHAETQISGYLVLIAMSIAYWRLHGNDRTRRGTSMVWLFFAGGVCVAIALLANVLPLSVLYVPLDVAAFVLLLSVVWRRVLSPGWLAPGSARHYAIAIPFSMVYLVIFIYLIVNFAVLQTWKDISEVPENLFAASVHPLFVGMVTNILFGLLYDFNADRRVFPWADHIVFWGMNLAVAAFTAVLLLDLPDAFKFVTPVLGLSILVGIVTHTIRMRSEPVGAVMEATSAS
jgi:uncharacterized protein (DUF486 family)